jgi:hypothetical protein
VWSIGVIPLYKPEGRICGEDAEWAYTSDK